MNIRLQYQVCFVTVISMLVICSLSNNIGSASNYFQLVSMESGMKFTAKPIGNIANDSSKIDRIIHELETYNGKRYFVYDSKNLTLPHIRAKAKDPAATPTWGGQRWTRRFRSYAEGELRFYEALEEYKHSNLRTFNASEADFVLVPIPLGATIFWGSKSDIKNAFNHLFTNEPFFQMHPERHVYITTNERLFRSDPVSLNHFHRCCGLTKEIISKISPGTMVKDTDVQYFRQYLLNNPHAEWDIKESMPMFRHYWNLGYSHEASDKKFNLSIANFDNWKKKEFTFFYRSIKGPSLFNSTQYRHALFQENMTETWKLIQPSAVGFPVPHEQWLREFSNSKFCLVVRGDNPSSRSYFTGIRLGCIPVIVSDALPYFQPMFRSFFSQDDFSVIINETEFLLSPAETLNNAIMTLTDLELRNKIHGLALLQRLIVLDHQSPLFVPAFVHETIARQHDNSTM